MTRTIMAIAAVLVAVAANARPAISPEENQNTEKWLTSSFAKGKLPPFSFTYGGESSDTFITKWEYNFEQLADEDGATRFRVTYTDPETGLEIACDLYAYPDYNAAEWVMRLRNTGTANTPQISNFKACDLDITGTDFQLLYSHGSQATRYDFTPMHKTFATGDALEMHPNGGRSSDGYLPFFNIYTSDDDATTHSGVVVSVGWSGTWQANMKRNTDDALNITFGQMTFDTYLLPGESVRTPRASLMLWEGDDEFYGNNKFRRFILNCHTHKTDGKPTIYPTSASFSWGTYPSPCNEYSCLDEDWAIALVKHYRYYGIVTENFWLDAGWSKGARETNWWDAAGNWIPDPDRFPNGFKNISDVIHEGGQKFLVWFEPERVEAHTLWREAHPEWMLHSNGAHYTAASQDTDSESALLNLADSDAVEWLSNEICKTMEDNGIDYYRQDFNIAPEGIWRTNEPNGRKGIVEAKYIEGLYRYWDNILKRIPGVLIDNCASGGRRIDLETTMRSAPLWRTDYTHSEANGYQCHTYGINLWLPQSGAGSTSTQTYDLRSCFGSSMILTWNIMSSSNNLNTMVETCDFLKNNIRYYYMEDYYPLMGVDGDITGDDVFLAYQLDKPSDGTGYVLAFRRPNCTKSVIAVSLHAIDPLATYTLTYHDTGRTAEMLGSRLSRLLIHASEPRSSVLISYKKKTSSGEVPSSINDFRKTSDEKADAYVSVYMADGSLIRKDVRLSEATLGLSKGIYIINREKVLVR